MQKNWWKILTVVLLLYTFTAGYLIQVPAIGTLYETARNFYFHVPMWMAMMVFFIASLIYSVLYLNKQQLKLDIYAKAFAQTGLLYGVMGIITGAIWAKFSWGHYWSGDPKQNGAAIGLLIYFAYMVLRNSMVDMDKRARVSAVYNIFAFCLLIPAIWILPRLVDSLHPGGQGTKGNPGLNPKDMEPQMRFIFYPAIIGWTLLGLWITDLQIRIQLINDKKLLNA